MNSIFCNYLISLYWFCWYLCCNEIQFIIFIILIKFRDISCLNFDFKYKIFGNSRKKLINFNLVMLSFFNDFPVIPIGFRDFNIRKIFFHIRILIAQYNIKSDILSYDWEKTTQTINEELIDLISFFNIVKITIF